MTSLPPSNPVSEDQARDRVYEVTSLIDTLRPFIQQDGGDIELLSVDPVTGVLEVQLQGACSSCAISSTTLTGAVARIINERCEWVTEIKGSVDDSMDFTESSLLGSGSYVPKSH